MCSGLKTNKIMQSRKQDRRVLLLRWRRSNVVVPPRPPHHNSVADSRNDLWNRHPEITRQQKNIRNNTRLWSPCFRLSPIFLWCTKCLLPFDYHRLDEMHWKKGSMLYFGISFRYFLSSSSLVYDIGHMLFLTFHMRICTVERSYSIFIHTNCSFIHSH